jgi:hypothetical protein
VDLIFAHFSSSGKSRSYASLDLHPYNQIFPKCCSVEHWGSTRKAHYYYIKCYKSQICGILIFKLHFSYAWNVIFVLKYMQLNNMLISYPCLTLICHFIWSSASGLMRFCNGSNKGTASDFVQISWKVPWRPWKWLDKHSGKKAWTVHGKSKLTETVKGETDEEQSQAHAHNFLWHQWDCSQRIAPVTPNSKFRTLLWHFMATAWKCAKTLAQSLATK